MAFVNPEPDDNDEEDMEQIEIDSSPIEALATSHVDNDDVTICPICAVQLVGLFATVSFNTSPQIGH